MPSQSPYQVTIVSPTFGKFGGIESFVFALAQYLTGRPEVGKVLLCFKRVGSITLGPLFKDKLAAAPFETALVDSFSGGLFKAVAKADVVHCQNPLFDVALCARLLRKPLAMTIHNWRRTGASMALWSRAAAFRLAHRHWYNSDFVWDSWEPNGRLATSGKPPLLSELPTGIVPAAERRGFLFVSRWIKNKGLEVLLDAYESSTVDRAAWPLALVGDGPLRPAIEARLAAKPIPGVQVIGQVSTEARNDLIRHARWMVTPPHTKEDLGLTPIEARHVGVPCIITRDGGLPEAGGRHALMCEPNDAAGLRRLLEQAAGMDEARYQATAEASHAELLGYLKPMSMYLDLYREMLADNPRPSRHAAATT